MGAIERIGMLLSDVPRNTKIRVLGDIKTPPASIPIEIDEIITFHKLDGMYSSCTNEKGQTVHLVAWAQVEIIKDDENGNNRA